MRLRKSNKTTGLKFPSVTVTTIKKQKIGFCVLGTRIFRILSAHRSLHAVFTRGALTGRGDVLL